MLNNWPHMNKDKTKKMLSNDQYDAIFAGVIGQEYDLLKRLSPLAPEMSRLVGEAVADVPAAQTPLQILELGGGTGITTLALLSSRDDLHILSVEIEPVMQAQAKQNLHAWVDCGKVTFLIQDALSALQSLPDASIDIVASAYTLHNFLNSYRAEVIPEIFRVLKPGGQFINGDRYALDDQSLHTQFIQQEVRNYFAVLIHMQKTAVLQDWIVHLFNDESENHIMRESIALAEMQAAGFCNIQVLNRQEVNALVIAKKSL